MFTQNLFDMLRRLLFGFCAVLFATGLQAQITSVGLIGSATPGGWDVDTNMVQDIDSANLWTLTVDLIEGACKFRADDDWVVNWGNSDFPIGVGTQDGPDIPISTAGTYDITFNSNTGEYYSSVQSDIGIIGSATPFQWDADVNMHQDVVDTNMYELRITLNTGEAKFRQNDDWAVNWGDASFPSGTGVQDGANIPIPVAGEYIITFNKATGDYNFQASGFSSMSLTGDATSGGWGGLTAMSSSGLDLWTANVELLDGGLQFVADSGVVVWGGTDFPTGIGTDANDTIPVTAGLYVVTFNSRTLEYDFAAVAIYATVGIIGDATPGGWDNDTDMNQDPMDPSVWSVRLELLDGEAKFRADNDWADNWGAGTFPTGIAERDGANIPVTAGEYIITFNSFTLAYNFRLLVVYDTVGIIGNASPFMNWEDDVLMNKDPNDENMWTLSEITLIDAPVDGGIKFRANTDWAVNWGSAAFPVGTGTQDGENILCTAGSYSVMFNDATGEYVFGDPTSTTELLKPSSIRAFPNPATDLLNVDISETQVTGKVTLQVFDSNGRMVRAETQDANPTMQLKLAGLPTGYYTLQISSEKYLIGKKFVIAR
jgi:hypothetical protein